MGNSSSSKKTLTREEQDLKYLGDRFAFGDAELWHLYHAYYAIIVSTSHDENHHKNNNNNNDNDNNKNNNNSNCCISSFLTDWAIQSTLILEQQERKTQQKQQEQQQQLKRQQQQQQQHGDKKRGGVVVQDHQQVANNSNLLSRMSEEEFTCHLQALKDERLDSLQVVEQQILPVDLGNRLYRATCVSHGDDTYASSLYPMQVVVDENSNQEKKAATSPTAVVTSAAAPTVSNIVMDEYTRMARLTQMFEGFSNMGRRGSKAHLQVMFQACQHQKQRRSKQQQGGTAVVVVVSALEMVDMGYRLALAAEYLQQRHVNFQNNHKNLSSSDPSSLEDDHHPEENGSNHDDNTTGDDNNKKVDNEQDDDNDNIIASVDVASLLPPPPTSSWSSRLDNDLSLLSSSTSSSINSSSTLKNSSLRALARSMIEKGKRRRERTNNASNGGAGGVGGMMVFPQQYPPHDTTDKNIDNHNNNDNDDDDDDDDGFVELDDIVEWSEEVAPLFASTLPTFLHRILFPGKPYPPSQTPFSYPRILQESSFFVGTTTTTTCNNDNNSDNEDADAAPVVVHANSSPLLFGLACFSSSLSGLYFRLYTSASDGLSFNRLLNALLGYGGPTCIIIRAVAEENDVHDVSSKNDDTNAGGIFGAVSASPWKESKDFYGTSDCFLFQLSPITAVYRPTSVARSSVDRNSSKNTTTTNNNKKGGTGSGNKSSGGDGGPNYMYCNPHARSKGYDGQAHGIGFGGTVDQPRLFLDETFEQCYAGSQDYTFENGALLPPNSNRRKQYFQVDSIEVWGVGGTALVAKALDARQLARDVRQEGIRRARKVDKAQFLDDFKSGAIDSKAFAHQQQMDGRADQDCNERHVKNIEL